MNSMNYQFNYRNFQNRKNENILIEKKLYLCSFGEF